MRFAVILLLLLIAGCATTAPVVEPTVPAWKMVEAEPLPPDPATEKVPFQDGDWAVPMDEEECITKDGKLVADAPRPCPGKGGILLSEEKTARLKLFQLGYQQLRVNYVADRQVWAAQRVLYETRLKDAAEALHRAQPNWFQAHAFELGLFSGIVVGVGTVIGVLYGVAPAFASAPSP